MNQDTTLSLAPAMGVGIGKKLAERLLAREDFVELMEQAAVEGLKAMAPRRWDKEAGGWVSDPDMRTRTTMFFGLLAQMEGEPIKRIQHQHLGSGIVGPAQIAAMLEESPALQESVRRMMDSVKTGEAIKGRKQRQAAAIEAVTGEDLDK